MPTEPLIETFPNGLTLVAESMPHVRSASLNLLVPAGFAREPSGKLGLASLLAELSTRGAGTLDSRELSDAFDRLGVDRGEGVGAYNLTYSGGMLGRNLTHILPLYADMVRRPHLPEDELEPAREALLQDLLGLADSPDDRVMLALAAKHFPSPYDRNRFGTAESLGAITIDDVRAYHQQAMVPEGAILSVAGAFDAKQLVGLVGEHFGDWRGPALPLPDPARAAPPASYEHIAEETHQTQIALACPSAAFDDPDFYNARGAVGVLSGGMSSRLFTEVREKRGLCYSVRASHSTIRGLAAVVCYAGSRSERAQETLDVTVAELKRLRDGVTADELGQTEGEPQDHADYGPGLGGQPRQHPCQRVVLTSGACAR